MDRKLDWQSDKSDMFGSVDTEEIVLKKKANEIDG